MMLFRIAKTAYARDLSGSGPKLYGGRWNPKGISVIYTSENRSLAALEFYVHLSRAIILPGFSLVSIEIPETVSRKEVALEELPRGWRSYPAPPELAVMGAAWVRSKESLLLRVPSSVMPPEGNVLINPAHPEMSHVRIIAVVEYTLDQRLRP
jgi:RES domain-containing protein